MDDKRMKQGRYQAAFHEELIQWQESSARIRD